MNLQRKDLGFSMISVVASLAIAALSALALAHLTDFARKELSHVDRMLDMTDLKTELTLTFQNVATCTCQLKILSVNTTNPSRPVNINILRSSCDTTNPGNIIVQSGTAIPRSTSRSNVESVRLVNIRRMTTTAYLGELEVKLQNASGKIGLRPLQVPVAFEIDTSSGGPSNRPIKRCVEPAEPVTPQSCPPGMIMVGPPAAVGSFCIDRDERGRNSTTYAQAASQCASVVYLGKGSRICHSFEYSAACTTMSTMQNKLDDWEMVATLSSIGAAIVMGGNGCVEMALKTPGRGPYRCCY